MANVHIKEDLMKRLADVAERENRPVEEIIESALEQFASQRLTAEKPVYQFDYPADTKDVLLLIAKAADELGETSSVPNLSERSSELLRTEWPEYLQRRLRKQDNND